VTNTRCGIMKSNLILPSLCCRYQVVTFQHIPLNHIKNFVLCPFATVLKGLLPDLLGGKVWRLPVVIVNRLIFRIALQIEQLKQYRHNMFATGPGIRTITLTGDSAVQYYFSPIITIISINFVDIPAIVALFPDTTKRSIFPQELPTFKNYC